MECNRDYALRVIEQTGEFIRKPAELLDDRQRWAALDQASRDHCGLSLDAALALPNADPAAFPAGRSRCLPFRKAC